MPGLRYFIIFLCIWWDHWVWLCVSEAVCLLYCLPLEPKPFPRLTMLGTPSGKGLYLTVYPLSCPNTDTVIYIFNKSIYYYSSLSAGLLPVLVQLQAVPAAGQRLHPPAWPCHGSLRPLEQYKYLPRFTPTFVKTCVHYIFIV